LSDRPETLLADLLLKWEEAWDLGEDLTAELLCFDHPELEQPLKQLIEILKAMAWMKKDPATGSHQDEAADDYPGKTVGGRYQIESLIGFGGFGRVYKAFDPELERHVAIKLARSPHPGNSDSLLEEARKAAKLRHPGIVTIFDVGREDGQIFFVSEWIDGKNLADLIIEQPPDFQQTRKIIVSLGEALQFAHDQGFLHRDIKPANILIDPQGRVLIADFGIATAIDRIDDHRGGTPGTLPYMAPEQIAGEIQLIGTQTDVHALGVVFYELLTGELPYQGRTLTEIREQILLGPPKPFASSAKSIPQELASVCLKCLKKHPADRFENAAAVVEAVQQASLRDQPSQRSNFWTLGLVISSLLVLLVWQIWPGRETASIETVQNRGTKDNAFVFSGRQRILTPLKEFAPVTMEAWIKPSGFEDRSHYIIGSDVPSNWGIGIGILGVQLGGEKLSGVMKSNQTIPLGRWSHVAAVFGQQETRIYYNGSLVLTDQPTEPADRDTCFVIGNVGEQNHIEFFLGKIRSVRISRGERFRSEFVPDQQFVPDVAESLHPAVLIYDGSKINQQRIIDLSGNENHGVWEDFGPDRP
jgi:serine/threonine protein kinase